MGPSITQGWKRIRYTFNKILMVYVLSVVWMTSYYTSTFTKAYGWKTWFRGGQVESLIKGAAWPYYLTKPSAARVRF